MTTSAEPNNTILFVDDEPAILRSLQWSLMHEDYTILTAPSGEEGLELIKNHDIAVIVSDEMMPNMRGSEFLSKAREIAPNSVRMVLTGYADIDAAIDAINKGGAYRYLTKPWNQTELITSIKYAFERYTLKRENLRLLQLTEQQNQKLNHFNEELQEKLTARTAELEQSLTEKTALLREIYHRVKNNMQVIASMLKIQARYIDQPNQIDVFKECENRIHAMALVHERLYQSKSLDCIDLVAYIRSLTNDLEDAYFATAQHVRVNINGNDIHVGMDTAIPCGLIINELVSNAFKYAFTDRQNGSIDIAIQRIDELKLVLDIRDDGIGLPADIDTTGTNSMGMWLVHSLSQQLQGHTEIINGAGTHFRLHINEIKK